MPHATTSATTLAASRLGLGWVALLGVAIAASGCASLRSAQHAVFGGESGVTCYAAAADVPVRTDSYATGKVIGHLALHEKVTRTEVQRGFAHIEAEKSGLEGWVENAELLRSLPAAGTREPAKPASGSATAPLAEPSAFDHLY